jgi:sulfate transport system ATP-binding protein
MPAVVEDGRLTVAGWESRAPKAAPQGAVEVFFRPDEVAFGPIDGPGLTAEVRAVAQRGPDVRIECVIEGKVFELEAHGPTLPNGVAPGLALRVRPLRPRIYPLAAA